MTNQIIANETKYEGRIFKVEQRQIITTMNAIITRDVVVKNPAVVCLVRHRSHNYVVLCKEYRAGANSVELGFVAGIVDEGEEPMQAAVREIIEETGYSPLSIEFLGDTYSSAGFTNEHIYHFYVEVDGKPDAQDLDNDEDIQIVNLPFSDLAVMLRNGTIKGNHAHATFLRAALNGLFNVTNGIVEV